MDDLHNRLGKFLRGKVKSESESTNLTMDRKFSSIVIIILRVALRRFTFPLAPICRAAHYTVCLHGTCVV